jgi:tetratricopeptide (TPR) repeat protein
MPNKSSEPLTELDMKIRLLLLMVLALVAKGVEASESLAMDLFKQANAAYEAGDFAKAAALYDSIPADYQSFEVHYNAGNAQYRLGRPGLSIWHYENALMLNPDNEDLINNRKVVQKLVLDKIEELPVLATEKLRDRLSGSGSLNAIAWVALALMVGACLLFVRGIRSQSQRAGNLLLAGLLLVLSLGAHFSGRALASGNQKARAVVIAERIEVKTAPGSGETAFVLHEGTTADLLRSENDFFEIRIANGHVGWLPASAVKPL